MAEKHITGREALTEEQKAKIDAVRKLHECAHDSVDKIKLRTIDKFERQAGMTVLEKIDDEAHEDYAYKGSGLNQMFSTIKKITTCRGFIMIVVDEDKSEKMAKLQAFETLGPLADDKAVLKFVADHTDHTTLLTIPKFIKNLKNFVGFVGSHPEMFGKGAGGTAAREVLDEAIGAIRDAREYLRQNKEKLPEDWYNFLRGGDVQVTDKRKFVEYLGNDWETDMMKQGMVKLNADTLLVKKS